MSPINFELLRAEHPEFGDIWPILKKWFDKNSSKRYVELSILLRAFPKPKRLETIMAIQAMIDRGMLATAYRFRSPSGDLLEAEFDEPDKFPETLPDRDFSHNIPTDSGDIVSGYRWEPIGAA